MTHRECKELFVEALYDEWKKPQKDLFDDHLSGCPDCRAAFEQLQAVGVTMKKRVRPELSGVEWTIFWNELSAEINRTRQESGHRFPLVDRIREFLRYRPAWGYGSAAFVILIVGMLIGRLFLVGPNLDVEQLSQGLSKAQRALLDERAQNYLQRSKALLLGIVNGSEITPSSHQLSKQQEVSRLLVNEAGSLRSQLTEADQQRMRKLVGDLEIILLQIANLEASKDFPELEIVRDGVERNGLLLKINLEQMRAQEQPANKTENRKETPSSSI